MYTDRKLLTLCRKGQSTSRVEHAYTTSRQVCLCAQLHWLEFLGAVPPLQSSFDFDHHRNMSSEIRSRACQILHLHTQWLIICLWWEHTTLSLVSVVKCDHSNVRTWQRGLQQNGNWTSDAVKNTAFDVCVFFVVMHTNRPTRSVCFEVHC